MTIVKICQWLILGGTIFFCPPLLLAFIRKTKAQLQGRIGASIFQPYKDMLKLLIKGQTISVSTSWVFLTAPALNCGFMILLGFILPWFPICAESKSCDLFFVLYAFAAMRFLTILQAFDTGSPFSAFGASREATLSILTEPAILLALVSIGIAGKSSNLVYLFSLSSHAIINQPALWVLAGLAILLTSIIELSRMPVDDPTTHLELTMIHEAMILESSGPSLALVEYSHCLKMLVLFGLASQCFIHALPNNLIETKYLVPILSITLPFLIGILLGILESVLVKLQWRKLPEFIAYALTMSILASFLALGSTILK